MEGKSHGETLHLDDDLPAILPKEEIASDEFYFESESYALLQNKDYQRLVKTLVTLETQKIQAIKGLEELHEAKNNILKDPLGFVNALQNGENFNFPRPIEVAEIPDIEWEKYESGLSAEVLNSQKRQTRRGNQNTEKEAAETSKLNGKEKPKSQSSKNLWTPEEQRKLEELLIKYPEERYSYQRCVKISKALGTRTPTQVQSHVQKYFIYLKKLGLPVPGIDPRLPKLPRLMSKKRVYHSSPSHSSNFVKAFDYELPLLSNPSETEVTVQKPVEVEVDISDEEDILDELKESAEYRELMSLKKAMKLKEQEKKGGNVLHYGSKCKGCSMSPIENTRWHCEDCPRDLKMDLCGNCGMNFENETHLKSHIMRPIKSFSLKEAIMIL